MRGGSANLIHRDAAGTWCKDETDRTGAAIRGVLGIGKAGVPTDFDPHIYRSGGNSGCSGGLVSRGDPCSKSVARLGLTHECLANEKGAIARGTQTGVVCWIVDAAFGDEHRIGRKLRGEFERGFQANVEGAQIAVVDTDETAAEME